MTGDSFSEAGVPGYDATTWHSVCAPRGTPRTVVALLHREIVAAINESGTRTS